MAFRTAPLNYAKLAPPRPQRSLQRPRLTAALRQVSDRKLVLLVAGPGYGKTTVLADFVASASARAAWYRLDDTDHDVVQFVSYLTAAIRAFYPTFGAATRPLLPRARASASVVQRLAAAVGHDLSLLPDEPLLIALDGFDLIASSDDVSAFIAYLLQFTRPNVRFFITSRALPSLPLAALRAAGALAEFGPAELVLTDDEVRRFLADIVGVSVGDHDRASLLEKTEGWPVGVVLATQVLRQAASADVEAILARFSGEAEAVYAYLAEEVFQRLDRPTREFLLRTSVFDDLDASACDHLLGSTDALEHLVRLEGDGLFTHAVVDRGNRSQPHYQYHRLFRGFLRERLRRAVDQAELRALHEAAGRILEAGDDWRGALECYFAAGSYLAAANTLQRIGEDLLETSAQQAIATYLERLPPEVIWNRPWLLALRGRVLRRQFRIESACELLAHAERAFERVGDSQGLSWVACEMAGVDFRRETHQQAVDRLRVALRLEQDPYLRAEMLVRLASNSVAVGEPAASIEYSSAADRLLRTLPSTPHNVSTGMTLSHARGLANALLGRLEAAGASIRDADTWESDGRVAAHSIGNALGYTAEMALLLGESEDALRRLSRAEPLVGGDPFWIGRINRHRGDALVALGDYAGAAAAYELAGPRGRAGKAFVALVEGRIHDALRLAEVAWADQAASENALARESARVTYGIALARSGVSEGITSGTALLDAAQQFFDDRGFVVHATGVLLHRASITARSHPDQAGETARNAIRRVLAVPGKAIPWWSPANAAEVCLAALRPGGDSQAALDVVASRLGREAAVLLRAVQTVPPELRSLLLEAVRRALRSDPDWDAALDDLATTCHDDAARDTVVEALGNGLLPGTLLSVRRDARLTWREVQVLSTYYLAPAGDPSTRARGQRRSHASQLGISENTFKVHVANLRRKLGVAPWAELHAIEAALRTAPAAMPALKA